MRYTAMMWMRRANMAALGGGKEDIMPDDWPEQSEREEWAEMHGYMRYRCPIHGEFWSDSGDHCEHCPEPEDTDPMDDKPFESENNI